MIDGIERKRMAKRAARESVANHVEPGIWTGNRAEMRIPFIGDRVPRGWRRTNKEPLFVDTSGFGAPGEPALTQDQMFDALTIGKGYALIEMGQFQGYVAEFERTKSNAKL